LVVGKKNELNRRKARKGVVMSETNGNPEFLVGSIQEIATQCGMDYAMMAPIVRYMKMNGIAKLDSYVPNPAGKGKGKEIWRVPRKFEIDLMASATKA
jgi:hypothetical protein